MTIRLLLADDQALVRGALAALLDLESDLEVVAQVGRGDEVVAAALASSADVCLLDIEMPGADGIEAAAALREAAPQVRSLIVTTFGRPGYLRGAVDAGVTGFVVKDTPAAELADAVRRVHAGLRVIDPTLATESLTSGDNPLTARECEVLRAALWVRRSRRSPHRCICRQVPSVTTCRRPSARRTRPPAPKPHASRANAAGSDRRDLSRIRDGR